MRPRSRRWRPFSALARRTSPFRGDLMQQAKNFIDGKWVEVLGRAKLPVFNPATGETLGEVPLSSAEDVDQAAQAAARAFPEWRRTPATDRVQYLFRLKNLMEEHFEELARSITLENGKVLEEARGEMRRAIENVEVACGIPILIQGYNSEDIARGIDESMIRQPLGVSAAICPFNFPGMIPFWFMPYALACGNTYIVKPSEKVPLTMQRIFALIEQTRIPRGVVNLINGASETVDAILDHPAIRAISFVGSTPVARYIYRRSAENGKRAQCQGGAKNPIVVLPDADREMTTSITPDSAFRCAGPRGAAASLAITVGEARDWFPEMICDSAVSRVTGSGLEDGVQMGPVITTQSKARIEELIGLGQAEGAGVPVDGRNPRIPGFESGSFVRPTILVDLPEASSIASMEIFGPVLGLRHVATLEEAICQVNRGRHGNMAFLSTSRGAAARKFRYEADAGDIGINVGI